MDKTIDSLLEQLNAIGPPSRHTKQLVKAMATLSRDEWTRFLAEFFAGVEALSPLKLHSRC